MADRLRVGGDVGRGRRTVEDWEARRERTAEVGETPGLSNVHSGERIDGGSVEERVDGEWDLEFLEGQGQDRSRAVVSAAYQEVVLDCLGTAAQLTVR